MGCGLRRGRSLSVDDDLCGRSNGLVNFLAEAIAKSGISRASTQLALSAVCGSRHARRDLAQSGAVNGACATGCCLGLAQLFRGCVST